MLQVRNLDLSASCQWLKAACRDPWKLSMAESGLQGSMEVIFFHNISMRWHGLAAFTIDHHGSTAAHLQKLMVVKLVAAVGNGRQLELDLELDRNSKLDVYAVPFQSVSAGGW
jgi:hypothetical protein